MCDMKTQKGPDCKPFSTFCTQIIIKKPEKKTTEFAPSAAGNKLFEHWKQEFNEYWHEVPVCDLNLIVDSVWNNLTSIT